MVQFAGVVLIKDASSSDAAAPALAEKVEEQTSEGQEGSEGAAKPSAEEHEAAEDGESLSLAGKNVVKLRQVGGGVLQVRATLY